MCTSCDHIDIDKQKTISQTLRFLYNVKGKSCLTNLLETMNCIKDIIDQGDPVDIFYFDFRKAFDHVPHKRLLYKLECLGIKGKVLNIIHNFLSG